MAGRQASCPCQLQLFLHSCYRQVMAGSRASAARRASVSPGPSVQLFCRMEPASLNALLCCLAGTCGSPGPEAAAALESCQAGQASVCSHCSVSPASWALPGLSAAVWPPCRPMMAHLPLCAIPSVPTTTRAVQGGECEASAGVQPICPEICQQGLEGAQGVLLSTAVCRPELPRHGSSGSSSKARQRLQRLIPVGISHGFQTTQHVCPAE